jgi:hypothetical protein
MKLIVVFVVLCLASTVSAFQVLPGKISVYSPPSYVGRRPTTQLNGFFGNFLEKAQKTTEPEQPEYDTVVIDPDFRVAGAFLALGLLLDQIPYVQILLGLPVTALGILFLVQTFRIRFVFDEENCLELKTSSITDGGNLKDSGENVVVGGANRWKCDSIVNYDFFPKGWIDDNPIGPVLVYFKETQTDPSTWNEGPGKSANDPEKIAAGKAVAGQVHFFPTVCNAQQIRAEFEKRGCGKIQD